jgi:hypothetical protein
LDEVDPNLLSEIKETLSSYSDLMENNPNAYEMNMESNKHQWT